MAFSQSYWRRELRFTETIENCLCQAGQFFDPSHLSRSDLHPEPALTFQGPKARGGLKPEVARRASEPKKERKKVNSSV